MKWMKQFVDEGEPFETTEEDVREHLKKYYKDLEITLNLLPLNQKLRNPFAYYWKEVVR